MLLKFTLQEIFIPILLSALTTMGGFISLLSADIKPINWIGLYSTLGIFFGFLLSTFFLGEPFYRFCSPVALPSLLFPGGRGGFSRPDRPFLAFYGSGNYPPSKPDNCYYCSGTGGFNNRNPRIQVETTVEEQIGVNHPLTKLLKYFQERFGGTSYNYLYIETEKVKSPLFWERWYVSPALLNAMETFADPSSIADFICNLNEAMDGWKAIPDTREKVENLWFLLKIIASFKTG